MNKHYKLDSRKRPVRILIYIVILTLLWLPVYLKISYGLQQNIDELKTELEFGQKQLRHMKEDLEQAKSLPSVTDKANFKSWMDYRAITAVASMQMELQKVAKTDRLGRRIVDGSPLIAIGSGWGCSVGDRVVVHFKDDNPQTFIVGDIKADRHTDAETHKIDTYNGSIIEFIVDSDYIPKAAYISGNFSSLDIYSSPVTNLYPEVCI